VTTASGLEAEDVAALCLLAADGDLGVSLADLADLLEATERRARTGFGPAPGALRRAFAGLVLEAGLAAPEELRTGTAEDVLARLTLRDLLGPVLSRDRLWFDAGGGVHWSPAAPASLASPGSRRRVLLALAASRARPPVVLAALERLGVDRSFLRALLDRAPRPEDEDLRRQVSYQDWYE
jgi:hypothetical protein